MLSKKTTWTRRLWGFLAVLLMATMVVTPVSLPVYAAGTDGLTDTQKNSSYGFFVWLSENADTQGERADAKVAAKILTNTVPSSGPVVFNNGNFYAGSTLGVSYEQLLSQTSIGAENDATSLECLRDAIHFVTTGNEYRAKENLAPLKISSGMMAIAEVDVNYQGYNGAFAHSNLFATLENLAYRMLGGTWVYGDIPSSNADDPYEGWYTKEKKYYDAGNTDAAGHYKTMTDRQGVMLITGFGVRHRFTTESLKASDGQYYECLMDRKYYSQQYSDNSSSYFYKGTGITPGKYEAYLDKYICSVLGHQWDNGKVTKDPTCTNTGNKVYTCNVCGGTRNETIDALGHKMTQTAAVNPDCTTAGNSAYYTCSTCKKYFSDAQGQNEIAKDSWILKAKGHSWASEYTVDKPATCTAEGSESKHCTVCGVINKDSVRAIEKTAHKYGEWKTVTEAKCTVAGSREKVCADCGDKVTEEIPAPGHKWGEWEVTKEATEEEDGEEARSCSVCKEKETRPVPALAHVHKPEHLDAKDATCTEAGNNECWQCTKCKRFYADEECTQELTEEQVVLKAKGHTKETVKGSPATCTENGLTDGAICSVCKAELVPQTVIVAAGHTYGDWTVTQEATTEAEGSKERFCTVCGDKQTEVIPKIGTEPDPEPAPAPGSDPDQMGADGTAVGEGASAAAAEAAVTGMKNDNDLPGSVFGKLQLRSTKQTTKSVAIAWTKVKGAKSYVIYGNKCGKANKMKKLAESTGKSKSFTKILGKKVAKGTYYKFMVVALDENNNVVSSSKVIHVATKGGKVGNYGKVTTKAKKNKATIKKGKTFKLGAKAVQADKKLKVKKHRGLVYETSNKKVATVNNKGVIKGVKKGTCYVYVYTQSGTFAKIKVTVK